jgi:hypothetical protein
MILTRRGFLAGLASIPVAVAAGDLLWLPGQKIISLPPAPVWVDITDEIQFIVRRAFVPKIVQQVFNTSPVMAALISEQRRKELDAMVERYLPGLPETYTIEFKPLDDLPMVPVDIWKRA